MSTDTGLPPLDRVVGVLARLPGIGRKTATRLAFHLLEHEHLTQELADALGSLHDSVGFCECGNYAPKGERCAVCSDGSRDSSQVCIVSKVQDLLAIERSGVYRGVYWVLGGLVSPLDGIGPDDLRIAELMDRVDEGSIQEVILALDATVDGDTTSGYVAGLLRDKGVRVSRIAAGIPFGGELEYADSFTIGQALNLRRDL